MSVMEELVQLERALDQLANRFDGFLAHEAGATLPAAAEIGALEERLRQLSLRGGVSPVEKGRLQQLTSRLSTKAVAWRRLAPQDARGAAVAAVPQKQTSPEAGAPAVPGTQPGGSKPTPAAMEEYRRLFARLQATMEHAGEPIPVNFARFVQDLEEQRQRLTARGLLVEGFDVVREPSGVHVRPRTRSGGR